MFFEIEDIKETGQTAPERGEASVLCGAGAGLKAGR